MSASQHGTHTYARWFRERIHRLREDPAFQREVDAIIALRTGVWQEDYLREVGRTKRDREAEEIHWRDALTHFACLSVSPHQGRPAILERVWAFPTRKTWKALNDFPRQLEAMADEVARINHADHFFFTRRRHNDLPRSELEILGRKCRQLPDIMRTYAKALRERNAAVAKASPHDGRFEALHNLSELVNLLTGATHDNQVEQLQRAAALALGERDRSGAESIAQVRYRRRKKSAQT